MKIEIVKVKQYCSTYKNILMIDGKPILIAKSPNTISKCLAYLENKNIELSDGKVKRILDEFKEREDK
jgi:hypothetical protein